MGSIKYFKITTLLVIAVVFSSCSKNKGCTDKNATNFNSSATKDDGSCTYSAYIVFWYNSQTASHLASDGYTSIKCSINGSVVGTSPSNASFNSAPTCGQSGSLSITQTLVNTTSQTVNYVITDANNSSNVIWSGQLSLTAGVCTPQMLTK